MFLLFNVLFFLRLVVIVFPAVMSFPHITWLTGIICCLQCYKRDIYNATCSFSMKVRTPNTPAPKVTAKHRKSKKNGAARFCGGNGCGNAAPPQALWVQLCSANARQTRRREASNVHPVGSPRHR